MEQMKPVLHEAYVVRKDDYEFAGTVSSKVKKTLSAAGISPLILRRIAVACYESEINMIIHSFGGTVTLDVMEDETVRLVFADVGPGIPDLEKAMTPGFSTANQRAIDLGFGAGMGLPNIRRVSDEFEITSSPDGTTLTLSFRGSL